MTRILPIDYFLVQVLQFLVSGEEGRFKVKKYAIIYNEDAEAMGYFHSVDPETGSLIVTDEKHNIIRSLDEQMFLDADIFEDCVNQYNSMTKR